MKEQTPAQKRAAEVRAELAAIAAQRDQRQAAQAETDELEQLERTLRDNKAIDQAERELGKQGRDIEVLSTQHYGVVIVKKPNPITFKKFQDVGDTTTTAQEALVRTCLVYPQGAQFDEIVEKLPGIVGRCALAVGRLAGVRIEEVTGK